MASIPDRLRVSGRQPDPIFDAGEFLYVRCKDDQVDGLQLKPAAIKFPNWSTNRSKYSEPEDVLLPSFSDWRVAKFKVGHIPKSLQEGQSKVFSFRPVHDPVHAPLNPEDPPENYAHTEVRAFKDGGVFNEKMDVPTTIKKSFRTKLSEHTEVLPISRS